jgi:ABC-type transport system substrate-binding protein
VRLAATAAVVALLVVGGVVALAQTRGGDRPVTPHDPNTLKISQPNEFRTIDPALAQRAAWEMEYAACAKLEDYDHRGRLLPDLARSVVRTGNSWTFRMARGRRFSNGRPVRAADVAWTIERVRSPLMQSPARIYLRDVRDVSASGDALTIRLARPVPDLRDRLALPYFCVLPKGTSIDRRGIGRYPSAGPYYISAWIPRRVLVLRPNPGYRGPRKRGPRQIVYTFGAFASQVALQVERGDADYGPIQPEEFGTVARRYGLTGDRVRVAPRAELAFIAFNTERPLFKDNPQLRKAVNFALDRRVLARQLGEYGGTPTDQYLSPSVAGFRDADIYPLDGPDLAKARELARGHLRSGVATYFTCNDAPCRSRAEAVQAALAAIGLTVRIRTFYGADVAARRVSTRGERFDLADGFWQPEYPDPLGLFERLLSTRSLQRIGNANLSYFSDAGLDARLERLAHLSGDARYEGFGRLDVEVARDLAPIAAYANLNARAFVSPRVGCARFNPVYGFDIANVCLARE